MELSERSITEHMQSKLLDCEQACADLNNELSSLAERWEPKGLHMEQREDEVRAIHKALKECIRKQHDVAFVCDMIGNEMNTLEDQCADLEMYNKDSEELIKEYTAKLEGIQKDNEKMSLSLHHAEEKINELYEKNSSMLSQICRRKYHQGAERKVNEVDTAYNRNSKFSCSPL